jgi:hypothetical protein
VGKRVSLVVEDEAKAPSEMLNRTALVSLEALRMWEACWSHYQTDYFHLFICISIMAVYGEDIVQQNLGTDDMLLHFNSLAMHMSGQIVLKKVDTEIQAAFRSTLFALIP